MARDPLDCGGGRGCALSPWLPAKPRESADPTEGGGGNQTVGDPKTLLLTLPNLPVTDPPAFVPSSGIGHSGSGTHPRILHALWARPRSHS